MIIYCIKSIELQKAIKSKFGDENVKEIKVLTGKDLASNPEITGYNILLIDIGKLDGLGSKKNIEAISKIHINLPIIILSDNDKKLETVKKSISDEGIVFISGVNRSNFSKKIEEVLPNLIPNYTSLQEVSMKEVISSNLSEEEEEDTKPSFKPKKSIKPKTSFKKKDTSDIEVQEEQTTIIESNIDVNENSNNDEVNLVGETINENIESPTQQTLQELTATVLEELDDMHTENGMASYNKDINDISNRLESASNLNKIIDELNQLSIAVIENETQNTSKAYNLNKGQIEELEKDIIKISHSDLSIQEKLQFIETLCKSKLNLQAENRSSIITSVCNILLIVEEQCKALVTEIISKKKYEVSKIKQYMITSSTEPTKYIETRQCLISDLTKAIEDIEKITSLNANLAYEAGRSILEGVPTNNKIINDELSKIQELIPKDYELMISKIHDAFINNSIKLSALTKPLLQILRSVTGLIEIDNKMLLEYEANKQKVYISNPENLVQYTSPTKQLVRLFIGTSGKGSTTAICHELCSRKGNTLTIDLTESNITSKYLGNQQSIEESISVGKPLHTVLRRTTTDDLNIDAFINFLSLNAQEYKFINIVLNDKQYIDKLADYALSVIFICMNQAKAINETAELSSLLKQKDNVARRFVVIGEVYDDNAKEFIVDSLGVQGMRDAFLIIPTLSAIPYAEMKGMNPALDNKVAEVYDNIIR